MQATIDAAEQPSRKAIEDQSSREAGVLDRVARA
jgi:hypothetical protein